jgi:hypothetical protein
MESADNAVQWRTIAWATVTGNFIRDATRCAFHACSYTAIFIHLQAYITAQVDVEDDLCKAFGVVDS